MQECLISLPAIEIQNIPPNLRQELSMFPVNILLIEHHAAFQESVATFLTLYADLKVVATAKNVERALCETETLVLDVILVDLDLRSTGRLSVLRQLRNSLPEAGIIALSLQDQDFYQQAVLLAGADEFVSKMRVVEDLVPTIQRVAQLRLTGPDYSM